MLQTYTIKHYSTSIVKTNLHSFRNPYFAAICKDFMIFSHKIRAKYKETGLPHKEKTSADKEKTSTDKKKTSTDMEKTSTDKEKTSTDYEKTSTDYEKTSTDMEKTLKYKEKMPKNLGIELFT